MDIDDRIGESGAWTLPVTSGDPIEVKGMYLGMSSSYRPRHRPQAHSKGVQWAPPKEWCSACRWSEFRIFREDDDDLQPYLIHKTGRTHVPGEVSLYSFVEQLGAEELIECLTTRRHGAVFLSIPAGRVLSQAVAFDQNLKAAWNVRRVV